MSHVSTNTGEIAQGIDANGQLYQQRALKALPILVRQAKAGQTIYYGELAAELGMSNPRNLNLVLGSVGTSLRELGEQWRTKLPPLQALAFNRADDMPGVGFAHSLVDPKVLLRAPSRTRKQVIDGMLADVFTYPQWDAVLAHFGAPPATLDPALPAGAATFSGGPESAAHLALKQLVASDPRLVGIREKVIGMEIEHRLPSGDEIDVLVRTRRRVVAVEVKPAQSPETDLVRGIFQCVKYQALLDAVAVSRGEHADVETVLAIAGALTPKARALANTLGVRALEQVGHAAHHDDQDD